MKDFKTLIVFFACIIIQIQLSRLIPFFRIVPIQLLLISLVYFSLDYHWFGGLIIGIIAGTMLDINSGSRLGTYALSYGIIGLLIGWIQPMIFKEEFLPRLFIILIATLALQSLNYQIIRTYQPNMSFMQSFYKSIIPGALINCVVAIPFLLIMQNKTRGAASWNRVRRRG